MPFRSYKPLFFYVSRYGIEGNRHTGNEALYKGHEGGWVGIEELEDIFFRIDNSKVQKNAISNLMQLL